MFSSLLLIFLSLAAGYILQRILNTVERPKHFSIKSLRNLLQKTVLVIISPVTVIGSIWVAPLKHIEILALPVMGIIAIFIGGILAFFLSPFLGLKNEQRGVYTIAGGFTNMGALGGLVSFILLGEKGFALVAFYQLFEKLIYFGVGFPLAKNYSIHKKENQSKKELLLQAVADPVILINLAALAAGIALNLSGLQRPEFFYNINNILVPSTSVGLLLSIGLGMQFSKITKYWKPGVFIVIIKSFIIPAFILLLGIMLKLHNLENGLIIKFLLIISSMPVAFIALVPPALYDMDLDLANSCWLFSTAGLVITIPLLSHILPFIG